MMNTDKVSNNQAQVVAVVILLAVVALIMGGLYLAQATTNITTVREIEQIREQRNQIQRENEGLKADIARLQSVENMKIRAATLGYREAGPDDMQWLIVENYTYAQPTVPPTPMLATSAPQSYEENFAGWLKRQFDKLREQFREWSE